MIPLYGDGGGDREAQIEAWLKRTGRILALLGKELPNGGGGSV